MELEVQRKIIIEGKTIGIDLGVQGYHTYNEIILDLQTAISIVMESAQRGSQSKIILAKSIPK